MKIFFCLYCNIFFIFIFIVYDIFIVKNFMIDVKFYFFLFILSNIYIVLVCIFLLDIGFK